MQQSRFVFVVLPVANNGTEVIWVLVSPNNRPLGRSVNRHESYTRCYAALLHLREALPRATATIAVEQHGQWSWQIALDGAPVARSSRSYLRVRECNYNLDRFLETVPEAAIVPGTRRARRDRRVEVSSQLDDPVAPGGTDHQLLSGRW